LPYFTINQALDCGCGMTRQAARLFGSQAKFFLEKMPFTMTSATRRMAAGNGRIANIRFNRNEFASPTSASDPAPL
jgi:hypothetical protein